MEGIFYYTKKAIYILLCLQILLVSIPYLSFQSNGNALGVLVKKGAEKKHLNNPSDKEDLPEKEDESKDEQNKVENKILNAHHKELALCYFQKTEFEFYNSKNKIQFHPEFSTPPPKQHSA